MDGSVGVLNVGAGDIKLSFDKKNPAERIRAARVVRDMLRRGYVLGVEVKPGEYERAIDFDETRCEYIVWDFDSAAARMADTAEAQQDEKTGEAETSAAAPKPAKAPAPRGRRGPTKRVAAEGARAIAVGRSAGG